MVTYLLGATLFLVLVCMYLLKLDRDRVRALANSRRAAMDRLESTITELKLSADRIHRNLALDRNSLDKNIKMLEDANKALIKAHYQGKASDAKMRAFRNRAPVKLYGSMTTWLNKAIEANEFKDWKNKPTPIKVKGCD